MTVEPCGEGRGDSPAGLQKNGGPEFESPAPCTKLYVHSPVAQGCGGQRQEDL